MSSFGLNFQISRAELHFSTKKRRDLECFIPNFPRKTTLEAMNL